MSLTDEQLLKGLRLAAISANLANVHKIADDSVLFPGGPTRHRVRLPKSSHGEGYRVVVTHTGDLLEFDTDNILFYYRDRDGLGRGAANAELVARSGLVLERWKRREWLLPRWMEEWWIDGIGIRDEPGVINIEQTRAQITIYEVASVLSEKDCGNVY